jgi:hypothetical protein
VTADLGIGVIAIPASVCAAIATIGAEQIEVRANGGRPGIWFPTRTRAGTHRVNRRRDGA